VIFALLAIKTNKTGNDKLNYLCFADVSANTLVRIYTSFTYIDLHVVDTVMVTSRTPRQHLPTISGPSRSLLYCWQYCVLTERSARINCILTLCVLLLQRAKMSDDSETIEGAQKGSLAEVTDDSCTLEFIEIVPLDRPSDDYHCTTHQNLFIQLLRSSQKTCRRWNRNQLMKMTMEIHIVMWNRNRTIKVTTEIHIAVWNKNWLMKIWDWNYASKFYLHTFNWLLQYCACNIFMETIIMSVITNLYGYLIFMDHLSSTACYHTLDV